MKYLKFLKFLQENRYFLFSLQDINLLFAGMNKKTIQNQLTEWVKKGYIIRLKRNLYELSQKGEATVQIPDLYVGNRLCVPSYVSLETALSIYNIIPEVSMQVSSVTTKTTRVFKNCHGRFYYFSCQPRAYTGYLITKYSGYNVVISEKEKAVVDYLYFKTRKEDIDFGQERFDRELLAELDWQKLGKYSRLFNKKLIKLVTKLKEFAGC